MRKVNRNGKRMPVGQAQCEVRREVNERLREAIERIEGTGDGFSDLLGYLTHASAKHKVVAAETKVQMALELLRDAVAAARRPVRPPEHHRGGQGTPTYQNRPEGLREAYNACSERGRLLAGKWVLHGPGPAGRRQVKVGCAGRV